MNRFALVPAAALVAGLRSASLGNIPGPGPEVKPAMKAPEIFQVKCDVHPWMLAYVRVFDHPYFATTHDDGTYSIDTNNLKDGNYTFTAWHEELGEVDQKNVAVKNGKAVVDFAFKMKGPNNQPPVAAPDPAGRVAVA